MSVVSCEVYAVFTAMLKGRMAWLMVSSRPEITLGIVALPKSNSSFVYYGNHAIYSSIFFALAFLISVAIAGV